MSADCAERRMRWRAKQLGLRAVKSGEQFRITNIDGRVLHTGTLAEVNASLARYGLPSDVGHGEYVDHRLKPLPAVWQRAIDDYLITVAAAGHRAATLQLRRHHLARLARELGCPPNAVTAELLIGWFGRQSQWAIETRRGYRNTFKGFFAWAYRRGCIPVDLSEELPKIREPKPVARPAPDHAWAQALLAADARTTLMLRLAAEAGLRRAEIAQVSTDDVLESVAGAQLLVHGKGGKQRVVPIAGSLADLLRRGAAGHTPGAPAKGWLFPNGEGDHLSPQWISVLVGRVMPDGYTTHTLRHRFGTRAYRGSRNLRAVQQLMGHASIATTERYLAVDDDEIRAAMMAAL
jgi:integrase/recombinase XerC